MDIIKVANKVHQIIRKKFPDLNCEVVVEQYGPGMRASLVTARKKNATTMVCSALLPDAVEKDKDAVNGIVGQLVKKLADEWNHREKGKK